MANRRLGSATDNFWYKDAIIYELHVKASTVTPMVSATFRV